MGELQFATKFSLVPSSFFLLFPATDALTEPITVAPKPNQFPPLENVELNPSANEEEESKKKKDNGSGDCYICMADTPEDCADCCCWW